MDAWAAAAAAQDEEGDVTMAEDTTMAKAAPAATVSEGAEEAASGVKEAAKSVVSEAAAKVADAAQTIMVDNDEVPPEHHDEL